MAPQKKILVVLATILGGVFAGGVYLGGYWENIPWLDRISGPLRFKQFVAAPVPPCVHSVRKGYSGFPQGIVATHFKYEGTLDECRFLDGWTPAQIDPAIAYSHVVDPPEGLWTKTFKKNESYIFLREGSREGLLFIP